MPRPTFRMACSKARSEIATKRPAFIRAPRSTRVQNSKLYGLASREPWPVGLSVSSNVISRSAVRDARGATALIWRHLRAVLTTRAAFLAGRTEDPSKAKKTRGSPGPLACPAKQHASERSVAVSQEIANASHPLHNIGCLQGQKSC